MNSKTTPPQGPFIHPSAILEDGVSIGAGSFIWDHVHIRKNATLGHHVIVGEKSYIACGVQIGNFVKINAMVYIPAGVTVEDKVMISAGCIFVNDKYPRAYDFQTRALTSSSPGKKTLQTVVREGATVGAGATVLGGLEIGRFALVGAGSVVTRSVKDYAVVAGNPARPINWICACGEILKLKTKKASCAACASRYVLSGATLKLS